jgi:transcriptional regulator with XRE-family HTH domain
MKRGKFPYRQLGERLQSFRQQLQESVTEVSGAVELETDIIESYERGETRPSEDVLDLLINHFEVRDDEADELWDLAGYGSPVSEGDTPTSPTLVMIPLDNRVIYTDTANVTVNNYGVVISFMQNGPNGQPSAVSRVGMSLEHAKSVLEVLAKTIKQAENSGTPKELPGNSTKSSKNQK